jgi:hypothetical protein
MPLVHVYIFPFFYVAKFNRYPEGNAKEGIAAS